MANTKTELFEKVPVGRALLIMAVPTIVSQLITMIYNLADTFFIGMSDDPYKVAAASVVSILYFLLTSLSNLFGVGGGSLLSRLLGEKREDEARRVPRHILIKLTKIKHKEQILKAARKKQQI